jgi:uncharacterized protein (TIGR02996 family)
MFDSKEAAFLRKIAEEGDDNTSRLVFADWLEEHDEGPRAEFIRVQCELSSVKLSKKRRYQLRVRERELLNGHRQEWCQSFELPIEDVTFERGLISRMRLSRWEDGKLLSPAFAPWFTTLSELDLSGLQLKNKGLRAFAENARIPALRKLLLNENSIKDAGVAALAEAPGLPHLDTLYLFGNGITNAGYAALEHSALFRLKNLDRGEREEGYCMSPGEAEMVRRQYVRAHLLPVVSRFFKNYELLQSAALCVAQYWCDEASDAVHGHLVVSELLEPTLSGAGDNSSHDANLPNTHIPDRYTKKSSSHVSFYENGVAWDDNSGAIPIWAGFAPEGGEEFGGGYAPAVMFYRHGGYEFLPMTRPHLDGVQPEWGWEE